MGGPYYEGKHFCCRKCVNMFKIKSPDNKFVVSQQKICKYRYSKKKYISHALNNYSGHGNVLFVSFTVFARRFSALAQEDPENYHIVEVGFKPRIKAARHHATPPAAARKFLEGRIIIMILPS